MNFTDRLNQLVLQDGRLHKAIAADIGISAGSLSNYLKGRIPQADELVKIAKHFRLTTDELLGFDVRREVLGEQFERAAAIAEADPGDDAAKQNRFTAAINDARFRAFTQLELIAADLENKANDLGRASKEMKARADSMRQEWTAAVSYGARPKKKAAAPDPFPGVAPAVEHAVDEGALAAMQMSREPSRGRKGKAASTTGSKSGPSQ